MLTRLSPAHVAFLARPYWHYGWTGAGIAGALDYGPDGQPWTYTAQVRHPAGWFRHRMRAWHGADGTPLPSRSQQLAAEAQRHHAAQAARRAEQARAQARAADPGRVHDLAADARARLLEERTRRRHVADHEHTHADSAAAGKPDSPEIGASHLPRPPAGVTMPTDDTTPAGSPAAMTTTARTNTRPERGQRRKNAKGQAPSPDYIAREWLAAAGKPEPDADTVQALVPHTRPYRPDSWRWRAAVALLEHGNTPTPRAVEGLVEQRREQARARREQREQAHRRAAETTEHDHDQILAYVRDHRRTHGTGPLWREVGAHMGWTRNWPSRADRMLLQRVIGGMIKADRLTATTEPRSLDVAPPG